MQRFWRAIRYVGKMAVVLLIFLAMSIGYAELLHEYLAAPTNAASGFGYIAAIVSLVFIANDSTGQKKDPPGPFDSKPL